MPGSKSAGRVQSVALRLICEREDEIDAFVSQEYWQIQADFATKKKEAFTARLAMLEGKKLEKFSLGSEQDASAALAICQNQDYTISEQKARKEARRPAPPFNTSSLQQEASRKLHFTTSQTMQIAQKLYEGVGSLGGLITYMRTDGISMSSEAIESIRGVVGQKYGADYVPEKVRLYKNKSKNAQEAHEAVRPTDPSRTPESLAGTLDASMLKLYSLIWKRAVASQMSDAQIQRVSLDITSADNRAVFRASGQSILFPGFLALYEISKPKAQEDEDNATLPTTEKGDSLKLKECRQSQHFTQPPPRYSEASMVKKMEEVGIGRPSTYASTLKVLQDRGYVNLDQRRFTPEDRGRLVICFLSGFFQRYIDYDFTAALENQLDEVSGGEKDWIALMNEFWKPFWDSVQTATDLPATEVRDYIDQTLGQQYFRPTEDKTEQQARQCPACKDGRLHLNFGRHGLFIGCGNYPECRYIRQPNGQDGEHEEEYPQTLGAEPESSLPVLICKGPYGFYVQLGETPVAEKGKKKPPKPKRVSLLKGMTPQEVDLALALKLLSLPRTVGAHPETGVEIKASVGRYGPYLVMDGKYTTLPAADSVLDIGLNRAVAVILEKAKSGGKGKKVSGRVLGEHPDDQKPITVKSGRFGPYVQHGKVNATIPKDTDPDDISMERALELLAIRLEKMKAKAKK